MIPSSEDYGTRYYTKHMIEFGPRYSSSIHANCLISYKEKYIYFYIDSWSNLIKSTLERVTYDILCYITNHEDGSVDCGTRILIAH